MGLSGANGSQGQKGEPGERGLTGPAGSVMNCGQMYVRCKVEKCIYVHNYNIILENEKFFELKSRGYRDGIKRESLHIMELLSVQCLQVDDVIPLLLPAVCGGRCGSQRFAWWHYSLMGVKSLFRLWFQQGDNIRIASSTCRHCTLSNFIMCSDSYPTSILSLFFLYHPYIPYFLIQRIFHFLVSFLFLLHACMYSHWVSNSNGGLAPKIGLVLAYEPHQNVC